MNIKTVKRYVPKGTNISFNPKQVAGADQNPAAYKVFNCTHNRVYLHYTDSHKVREIEYEGVIPMSKYNKEAVSYQDRPSNTVIKNIIWGPATNLQPEQYEAYQKAHTTLIDLVRDAKRRLLNFGTSWSKSLSNVFSIEPTNEELDELKLSDFGVDKDSFINTLLGWDIIPQNLNLA